MINNRVLKKNIKNTEPWITNNKAIGKIIRREIPADIVYEDDYTLAFKDTSPQAPIHILIIPKKLIDMPQNITLEDAKIVGNLFLAAKEIAKNLNVTNGYRLVMNNGEEAGQSVFHIHLHFLAGRKLSWPPG